MPPNPRLQASPAKNTPARKPIAPENNRCSLLGGRGGRGAGFGQGSASKHWIAFFDILLKWLQQRGSGPTAEPPAVGRRNETHQKMTVDLIKGNNMNDTSSIESIIRSFYEEISGFKSKNRDWNRVHSLFSPGASLVPNSVVCGTSPPSSIGIEAYIQRLTGFLSQYDFFETGFINRIERYGNIACVISTYAAFRTPIDSEPYRRGVNFIQMLNDGKRWWLTSMIWRDEDKDNSIPEEYLKTADMS